MPQMSTAGLKAADVWAVVSKHLPAQVATANLAAGATEAIPANWRVKGISANANDCKLQVDRGGLFQDAVVSVTGTWVGCDWLSNSTGTNLRIKNDNVGAQTVNYAYEAL